MVEKVIGISDGEYSYVIYQSQKIYAKESKRFWYDKGIAKIVNSQEILNDKDVSAGRTTSAVDYYKKSYEFSKWVTENLGEIKQKHIQAINVDKDGNSAIAEGGENLEFNAGDSYIFNMNDQDPEDAASAFNQHRIAVIKSTIETNLIAAINSYNSNAGSYAYAMPELSEDEWEKVVNNVCIISFMQGMPIGAKYFNDYVVIPNDINYEFVDTDTIYLLTDDGQYHTVNCPDLVENKQVDGKNYQERILGFTQGTGYINTSFQKQTINDNYYYRHVQDSAINKPYTACYHCIVNASGKYDIEDIMHGNNKINPNMLIEYNIDDEEVAKHDITTLRSRYLTALAREKYNLYKTSNYYIEDTSMTE